jgi:hypothetical protein
MAVSLPPTGDIPLRHGYTLHRPWPSTMTVVLWLEAAPAVHGDQHTTWQDTYRAGRRPVQVRQLRMTCRFGVTGTPQAGHGRTVAPVAARRAREGELHRPPHRGHREGGGGGCWPPGALRGVPP